MVAAKSMEIYREAALERKREGGRKGGELAGKYRPKSQISGIRPNDLIPDKSTQSRVAAGEAVGTSGSTVERCLRVLKTGADELVEAGQRRP